MPGEAAAVLLEVHRLISGCLSLEGVGLAKEEDPSEQRRRVWEEEGWADQPSKMTMIACRQHWTLVRASERPCAARKSRYLYRSLLHILWLHRPRAQRL